MPKAGEKNVLSNGICTWPPSLSAVEQPLRLSRILRGQRQREALAALPVPSTARRTPVSSNRRCGCSTCITLFVPGGVVVIPPFSGQSFQRMSIVTSAPSVLAVEFNRLLATPVKKQIGLDLHGNSSSVSYPDDDVAQSLRNVYTVHTKLANQVDSVHMPRGAVMMDAMTRARPRRTYHHGDLRQALLDAGIALARDGGPDAVVLREATRRAGVVPNAAYRHFANRHALLQAVRAAALSALAVAMEKELTRLRRGRHGADHARAGLRAIGTAYLRFAQSEPGLFRMAFAVPGDPETTTNPAMAGKTGLNPFQLLGTALDRLVEAGVLPAERRTGAEYLAWSAVHGLAMLVQEGPLRRLTRAQVREIEQRLLDMVEKGL